MASQKRSEYNVNDILRFLRDKNIKADLNNLRLLNAMMLSNVKMSDFKEGKLVKTNKVSYFQRIKDSSNKLAQQILNGYNKMSSKYSGTYKYLGPGTDIVKNLLEDVKPVNEIDEAAREHDYLYLVAGSLPSEDVNKKAMLKLKADEILFNKLQKIQKDSKDEDLKKDAATAVDFMAMNIKLTKDYPSKSVSLLLSQERPLSIENKKIVLKSSINELREIQKLLKGHPEAGDIANIIDRRIMDFKELRKQHDPDFGNFDFRVLDDENSLKTLLQHIGQDLHDYSSQPNEAVEVGALELEQEKKKIDPDPEILPEPNVDIMSESKPLIKPRLGSAGHRLGSKEGLKPTNPASLTSPRTRASIPKTKAAKGEFAAAVRAKREAEGLEKKYAKENEQERAEYQKPLSAYKAIAKKYDDSGNRVKEANRKIDVLLGNISHTVEDYIEKVNELNEAIIGREHEKFKELPQNLKTELNSKITSIKGQLTKKRKAIKAGVKEFISINDALEKLIIDDKNDLFQVEDVNYARENGLRILGTIKDEYRHNLLKLNNLVEILPDEVALIKKYTTSLDSEIHKIDDYIKVLRGAYKLPKDEAKLIMAKLDEFVHHKIETVLDPDVVVEPVDQQLKKAVSEVEGEERKDPEKHPQEAGPESKEEEEGSTVPLASNADLERIKQIAQGTYKLKPFGGAAAEPLEEEKKEGTPTTTLNIRGGVEKHSEAPVFTQRGLWLPQKPFTAERNLGLYTIHGGPEDVKQTPKEAQDTAEFYKNFVVVAPGDGNGNQEEFRGKDQKVNNSLIEANMHNEMLRYHGGLFQPAELAKKVPFKPQTARKYAASMFEDEGMKQKFWTQEQHDFKAGPIMMNHEPMRQHANATIDRYSKDTRLYYPDIVKYDKGRTIRV